MPGLINIKITKYKSYHEVTHPKHNWQCCGHEAASLGMPHYIWTGPLRSWLSINPEGTLGDPPRRSLGVVIDTSHVWSKQRLIMQRDKGDFDSVALVNTHA